MAKRTKKSWTSCLICKYVNDCQMGQVRKHSTELNFIISSEFGFYNYEMYCMYQNDNQLKLFESDSYISA